MKIGHKLLLLSLAVSLIPIVVISIVSIKSAHKAMTESVGENFKALAKEKARAIEYVLDDIRVETEQLASLPIVVEALRSGNSSYKGKTEPAVLEEITRVDAQWQMNEDPSPEAESILASDLSGFLSNFRVTAISKFGEIFITDSRGATVAMTSVLSDYYQADEFWWQYAFDEGRGRILIDDRGYDESVGAHVIGVVVPVRYQGEVIGILKVNYYLTKILEIIGALVYNELDHIKLISGEMGVIVHSRDDLIHQEHWEMEGDMLDPGTPAWGTVVYDGETMIIGYAPVNVEMYKRIETSGEIKGVSGEKWEKAIWHLTVELDAATACLPFERLKKTLMAIGMLFAVVVAISAYKIAETISRPIQNLTRSIEAVGSGGLEGIRLDHDVGVTSNDEVGQLAREFTWMVNNLKNITASRDELNAEIAERRRMEEALQTAHDELELKVVERTRDLNEANERLKEIDRKKTMFLAGLSHELRTPLNSIIGFTGILLGGMGGDLNEEQTTQLKIVKNNANHLHSLINDLIDLSRIESGMMVFDIETYNLSEVVKQVVESFNISAAEKGIELTVETPDDLMVESDVKRTSQVLVNLVSNAINFTYSGGVEVKMHDHDGYVEVSVRDNGMGISSEDQDKIFNAFTRLNTDESNKYGRGLGLYLSRNIAGLLGGDITVSSEPGRGSEFVFRLPKKCTKVWV